MGEAAIEALLVHAKAYPNFLRFQLQAYPNSKPNGRLEAQLLELISLPKF